MAEEPIVDNTSLNTESILQDAINCRHQNLVFEQKQYQDKLVEVLSDEARLLKHIASFEVMRDCMMKTGAHVPLRPQFPYEQDPEYVVAKAFIEETRVWQAIGEHKRMLDGYKLQEMAINDELKRINDELSKDDAPAATMVEE